MHESARDYVPFGCSMSLDQAFASRESARKFYTEWVEDVKSHVPPEKLLTFHVQSGWKPLCEFLNVPLPPSDVAFPKTNDTKQIQEGIWKFQMFSWMIVMFVILFSLMVLLLTVCTIQPGYCYHAAIYDGDVAEAGTVRTFSLQGDSCDSSDAIGQDACSVNDDDMTNQLFKPN